MKTYGFNLLPQKSRVLVRKETKRDNYSVAIAILPLTGVIVWLGLILISFFVVQPQKFQWQSNIASDNATIYIDLAPILIKNGEMVTKTNALADVITLDVKPEQLFSLIDQIYGNQLNGNPDPTFRITGYSRNQNGSFSVTISAVSYTRLAEIARKFMAFTDIHDLRLDSASLDTKTNMVSGSVTFFFYQTTTSSNADTSN